ncbi:hypothetical protein [Tenacibaculum sp. C7A-26P2]|uniref:hypothetical protein n=1 Tax=Tenacibaculum sp. C7A-26P2 TaxID=3447504 RepID=UPI003F84E714
MILTTLKDGFEKATSEFISLIESSNKKKHFKRYISPKKLDNNEIYDLVSVLLIIIITYVSRMYFYKNDLFLFSENWFSDFDKLSLIEQQQWFNTEYQEMGEYALISLISKFFKLSLGMSLQMFGLLQIIILSILIYFIIKNISKTNSVFFPFLTSLFLSGHFDILPNDITLIFQHRKIFTVLIILLPIFIKISKKQHFYKFRTNFILLCLSFISIALTHFASIVIIIIPFVSILFIFDNNKPIKQKITLLFSPIIIGTLILGSFIFLFEFGEFNTFFFLKNSFIEVSNYTKMGNPRFDFNTITLLVSFSSIITILINIFNNRVNFFPLILCILYLLYVNLYRTNHFLIDKNLLLPIISILTPVCAIIAVFEILLNNFKWNTSKYTESSALLILLILFFIGNHYQKTSLKHLKESNETNRQLLSVYDKIITSHLPYSYAVSNLQKAMPFSESNHFFINYHELNKTYIDKDSIFHTNRKKNDFLKKHPEATIPNSVFIFEILDLDKNISRTGFLTPENQFKENDRIINVLKSRGRDILLFMNTNRVRVYKITNKKNSSDIDKMLFYDNRFEG